MDIRCYPLELVEACVLPAKSSSDRTIHQCYSSDPMDKASACFYACTPFSHRRRGLKLSFPFIGKSMNSERINIMGIFLDRYQHGEHEQVWIDLLNYGIHIRKEPLFSDALAVARETMIRARENIERIALRLHEINYHFEYPESAVAPAQSNNLEHISQLEGLVGDLPISLR